MSSQGDPENEPALRLRITHIMSSMAPPVHSMRPLYVPTSLPTAVPPGVNPSMVPVLRIFGTTPAHQKICANVHLCYPYFFVPFRMENSSDPLRPERVIKECQRFAVSLNHAICLALRQNPTGPSAAANHGGGTDPKHLHVVSVILVKAVPFYGYHIGYSYYMKVSLANPARLRIAVEQLHKPVVFGQIWQPHEAHLSHVLQFMCDFDLYGCGNLDLSGGNFREPLPEGDPDNTPDGAITSLTVPPEMLYPRGISPGRDTHSTLEIDVLPHQILNRNRLQQRSLHHDFIELLHQPLHPEEKLVPAMKELWEDERRRRAARGLGTSEASMLPVSGGGRGRSMEELGYKVDGVETENRGGDWKISEELWDFLEQRMEAERGRRGGKLTFNGFSRALFAGPNGNHGKYDKWILTSFEAVSAHWPKAFRSKKQQTQASQKTVIAAEHGSPAFPPPPSSSPPVLDEDDNPFDLMATQAASQSEPVELEIDASQVEHDKAERHENPEELAHRDAERVYARAERIRATQAPRDEFDEFDDEDLDELLMQIVPDEETMLQRSNHTTRQESRPTTPQKRVSTHPVTPSTRGSMSADRRKTARNQRLMEKAGFGDMSTIMEGPFALSSQSENPFADPKTPSKSKIKSSAPTTPASLVRSIFARSRTSSVTTPTRRSNPTTPTRRTPRAKTVVLQERTRSFSKWTPSPGTPPPPAAPAVEVERDLTPQLLEIRAKAREEDNVVPFPNAQRTPVPRPSNNIKPGNTPKPRNGTKRPHSPAPPALSPTLVVGEPTLINPEATLLNTMPAPTAPPKKRVRLSSPTQPPKPSSTPIRSGDSNMSHLSASQPSANSSDINFDPFAWQYRDPPPSARQVLEDLPSVEYPEPFYSNPVDVPPRTKAFAGRLFNVKGNGAQDLDHFETDLEHFGKGAWIKSSQLRTAYCKNGWEYGPPPPSLRAVTVFCAEEDATAAAPSQLAAPTQRNKYGFKLSQKNSKRESQGMSLMCLEIFAPSRHQLLPDPEKDEMVAVFYCFQNEDESLPDTTLHAGYHAGYVVVDSAPTANGRARLAGILCSYVDSELDLINWVIDTVKDWDPDVLGGWELHNSSWGYLAARAHEGFGMDLMAEISRVVSDMGQRRKDAYSAHHTSIFKVNGRHVLNIWRILRSEVTLNMYTFENVVFHVLHQRVPFFSAPNLTALWKSKAPGHTARVLKYFFQRVVIYAEVVASAEIVSKNAEFARVFGVDFDAVMFRGSQFKVESFIFRIAKPENFVMVSPSKQQVGLQNAPFAVPLIAEPESKYYTHPIVVLDFQSLYPSVMIAYNICFSTCLGRVEKFKGTDKFGFTELKVADGLLELLKDYLTVTPNGLIFVKPAVRKSLLAKMLGEILDTRVMVKNAMKSARGDKSLSQLLDARQLALKLMANVTYGYTSATFSGRMPCIEVADSIVQTGRETLEKAQELIHSRDDWGATVVYGDTDSLFIALPGRSKDEAFKIGNDIADTVTATNPKPVKLKFEKVYMGSVLMAKKRYVGFKYEHPDDTEPVFDAKGIETIRRDGFPAQAKMEEVCLKMLFRTNDLSLVKEFCRQEWTKILQGKVSLQDFIIAKEVRLGTYSEKGVPPPGAAVAYRRILKDPRDEPQYAERVPYLVSNAEGRRLIDRARMPEEMLANRNLGIDAEYYIRNLLIPPLERIFNLVGGDVQEWFDTMPRTKRARKYGVPKGQKGTRLDAHFQSSHCLVCGGERDSAGDLCTDCRLSADTTAYALLSREHAAQTRLLELHRICSSCSGVPVAEPIMCRSTDCPVTYARIGAERDAEDVKDARRIVDEISLDW